MLSWPPFLTIAFHRRSVSAWSSVAIWNENASLCLNVDPPLRPMQGMPGDGELDREDVALLAARVVGRGVVDGAHLAVGERRGIELRRVFGVVVVPQADRVLADHVVALVEWRSRDPSG
jgi:hypothetical protein